MGDNEIDLEIGEVVVETCKTMFLAAINNLDPSFQINSIGTDIIIPMQYLSPNGTGTITDLPITGNQSQLSVSDIREVNQEELTESKEAVLNVPVMETDSSSNQTETVPMTPIPLISYFHPIQQNKIHADAVRVIVPLGKGWLFLGEGWFLLPKVTSDMKFTDTPGAISNKNGGAIE